MIRGKNILAVITARGGSKGLRRKNIKLFNGSPLIVWTIKAVKKSKYVDKIALSSDNLNIMKIGEKYGIDVPFMRPKRLAGDRAKNVEVVLHAINWYHKYDQPYDYVLLLQPTSPLRTAGDIDRAVELLIKKNAKAVVSVCKTDHHPFLSNTLPAGLSMKNFFNNNLFNQNRQDFPEYYRINGAIYLANIRYLMANRGFYGNSTYAYVMPKDRSWDIDDEIDFTVAEYLMRIGHRALRQ